jgi:predicted secreted protein
MVHEKKIFVHLSAAALAVSLTACRYTELKEPAPMMHSVRTGEKFRITLPENHTKGQSWQLMTGYDSRVIRKLNEVWHGNEKGIDINLVGVSSGSTTLRFLQRQYNDTSAQVEYLVKITDY